MTSGSFNISTSNQYVSGYISWSESNENITNNTTDVTATMYLHRTNGYTSSGTDTFHVSINGVDHSNTLSYSLTSAGYTQMVTGTTTVTHNADGTKSITIGWSGGGGSGGVFTVNASSDTANLMSIPRASTVASSISWTAGTQDLPISLTVHDSSFHHSIQMWIQHTNDSNYDYVGQRTNVGSSTTWQFTQAEITQIYTTNNMYENRPINLVVYTYDSNGNQIGDYQTTSGNVYAVPTAYATINSNNTFNIGDSIPYTLNSYTTGSSSGFTYDFTLTVGSFTKSWNSLTAQTGSLIFTSDDITNLYNTTPNANSVSGIVTVRTKYNGVYTEDGNPTSHNTNITANVVNSNPTFGTGYTYADTNSTTTTITGDSTKIIQNKSSVTVTLPTNAKAVAINGAAMSKYIANLNGIEITKDYLSSSDLTFVFGTITASSDVTLSIKAIDSRGNSTTTTKTVTVLPYAIPFINSTVARANGFDTSTTLTMSGNISPLTVSGTNKNTIQNLQYRYKSTSVTSATTWDTWTNFAYTTSGATYTATNVTLTLDNGQSWNVEVSITDKFGITISALVVSQGVPFVAYDAIKKSVGLNGFPTHNNALEIFGDEYVSGTIYEGGNSLLNKYRPAGEITMYGASTAPSGWLLCQGQAVSRTTYSRLFTAIGTTYGTGDGSTTFNLPNLQSRVPVGYNSGDSNFNSLGKTGGEATHNLSISEIPSHNHGETWNTGSNSGGSAVQWTSATSTQQVGTSYTGGGQAHNNLQPYITLNFIIRT